MFIATCYSEQIGKMFFEAGVEHVICVHNEIFDDAAIDFSANFYELLFKETLTVC